MKSLSIFVLGSKLCPRRFEGTFYALLMAIDNLGNQFLSSRGGSFLLHILKVTRVQFDNLWLAIFIRNLLRLFPLTLLFLVPPYDPNSFILPSQTDEQINANQQAAAQNINTGDANNIEMAPLLADVIGSG